MLPPQCRTHPAPLRSLCRARRRTAPAASPHGGPGESRAPELRLSLRYRRTARVRAHLRRERPGPRRGPRRTRRRARLRPGAGPGTVRARSGAEQPAPMRTRRGCGRSARATGRRSAERRGVKASPEREAAGLLSAPGRPPARLLTPPSSPRCKWRGRPWPGLPGPSSASAAARRSRCPPGYCRPPPPCCGAPAASARSRRTAGARGGVFPAPCAELPPPSWRRSERDPSRGLGAESCRCLCASKRRLQIAPRWMKHGGEFLRNQWVLFPEWFVRVFGQRFVSAVFSAFPRNIPRSATQAAHLLFTDTTAKFGVVTARHCRESCDSPCRSLPEQTEALQQSACLARNLQVSPHPPAVRAGCSLPTGL